MGKNLNSCIKHLSERAKRGKMTGKFSVFPEEIPALEREGFIVTGVDSTELTGKNARKVEISWANPTRRGIAKQLKMLVVKYRYHCNSIARTCLVKADKRDKRKTMTCMDDDDFE